MYNRSDFRTPRFSTPPLKTEKVKILVYSLNKLTIKVPSTQIYGIKEYNFLDFCFVSNILSFSCIFMR